MSNKAGTSKSTGQQHRTGGHDQQNCLTNQDAACVAGVLVPLLGIMCAGADKLAAKSAALALAALTNDHTANQDAARSLLYCHCTVTHLISLHHIKAQDPLLYSDFCCCCQWSHC